MPLFPHFKRPRPIQPNKILDTLFLFCLCYCIGQVSSDDDILPTDIVNKMYELKFKAYNTSLRILG